MELGLGEIVGGAMVGEVEEASLDEVLTTLRQHLATATTPNPNPRRHPNPPKQTTIAPLDALASAHHRATRSAHIALTGRALPLVYAIASRLLTAGKTLLVVDLEGRFDVTRLACGEADLRHAYVLRPRACLDAEEVRRAVEGGQRWMVYGAHGSKDREWWGTLVVGGPGGDVSAGWRGWARVERDERGELGGMVSAEEALPRRGKGSSEGWVVRSEYGGFRFTEGDPAGGLQGEGCQGPSDG